MYHFLIGSEKLKVKKYSSFIVRIHYLLGYTKFRADTPV